MDQTTQPKREKTGGRQKGTPNKATKELKEFLDGVFADALADPMFRVELLIQIKTFKLDSKVFLRLLEYWAGAPPKQINVDARHTLEEIVSGAVEAADEDEDQ
jgi:hypothetical protein